MHSAFVAMTIRSWQSASATQREGSDTEEPPHDAVHVALIGKAASRCDVDEWHVRATNEVARSLRPHAADVSADCFSGLRAKRARQMNRMDRYRACDPLHRQAAREMRVDEIARAA